MLAEKRFQMFENLCTRQIYCILIKGVLKIKHYYELFSLCQCEQIKEEKKKSNKFVSNIYSRKMQCDS